MVIYGDLKIPRQLLSGTHSCFCVQNVMEPIFTGEMISEKVTFGNRHLQHFMPGLVRKAQA
jgi:hypothetical protein